MDKVKEGWIIFLDDDDMFTDKNCLKKINTHLNNDNDIVFWKFLRPDLVIFPPTMEKIRCGNVASCTYCFNSKFKNTSRWPPFMCGDYMFLEKLLKQNNFNRKFISNILTATNYDDKQQSLGRKERK